MTGPGCKWRALLAIAIVEKGHDDEFTSDFNSTYTSDGLLQRRSGGSKRTAVSTVTAVTALSLAQVAGRGRLSAGAAPPGRRGVARLSYLL
jgi:hypothetical protein